MIDSSKYVALNVKSQLRCELFFLISIVYFGINFFCFLIFELIEKKASENDIGK